MARKVHGWDPQRETFKQWMERIGPQKTDIIIPDDVWSLPLNTKGSAWWKARRKLTKKASK